MTNLKDLTLILPVKIESLDRYFNLKTVLSYINHHFSTNVKIIETSAEGQKIDFLNLFDNLNIEYSLEEVRPEEAYHRTKYLNQMLDKVTTKVTCNYDCDVLLPTDSFLESMDKILTQSFDFVYPYPYGYACKELKYSQCWEKENIDISHLRIFDFIKTFDLEVFNGDPRCATDISLYGWCIFANTDSYKKAYGENENFISYGPEDKERAYRFEKLGYKVARGHRPIYHLEHVRTKDSYLTNPYFSQNHQLFEYIKSLSKEDLVSYYKQHSYLDRYHFQ